MKFSEKNKSGVRVVSVVSNGKRLQYETVWDVTTSQPIIVDRKRRVIQGDHPVQIEPQELMRLHKESLRKYLRR